MSDESQPNVADFTGSTDLGEDFITGQFLDAVHGMDEMSKLDPVPVEWVGEKLADEKYGPPIVEVVKQEVRRANHLTTDAVLIERDKDAIVAKLLNSDPEVEILLTPEQKVAYDQLLHSGTIRIFYEFFNNGQVTSRGRPKADVISLHPEE